ncbi:vacuolar protein sorting-associated protein 18 homolog [Parasteatoda tepidariorum]|uniref:Vacuolar protein sorting-associated protein 18 homolog n=3 Tax=Parasteatoda tepidariorum TaxID=114398 RepID=A0A2L2YFR6_PARTP|nr:vacuolar protein sorting-associated protein 18 homolog isoform X1 [Parasteatoda tepidariorum]XP_042895878.1 vacuolar protein sorting-associated protein 18 homolog isoform X2 [Parasteatoda tepidariorum]XP_042895879.1 vacuolar protein sorting-associated protein 18 homolog isoform X1 [Parasteatoda tepidariorum]XP_042895880.1 vacuolar protein sorting-associated protein 18 homolog isoform X1 [Parasteatoda tepidariorum]
MASLFDQYEQAASLSSGYMTGKPVIPEMTTAGLINANLEDDAPMFTKKRINFNPSDSITHMTVCNNKLILGMRNKIRRMDLNNPDNYDDIDLQKGASERVKIYELFLDRMGKHLLISLVNPGNEGPFENLYLFQSSKKAQHCNKMKGQVISSVAWNPLGSTDNSTGILLIGTTKGLIFETELASGDDRPFFQSSPEQYFKQVFDLGVTNVLSSDCKTITGIVFHKISGDKYFAFVTTPQRLIQFMGDSNSSDPPVLQNVFHYYKDVPESHIELPGTLSYSKLQLYYPNPKVLPVTFGWMTEPGIVYGDINYAADSPKNLIVKRKLLHYPEEKSGNRVPLSIILTEFHVLVLFHDRLKVISVLNQQLVFEDFFSETYGSLKGIVKDPEKGTIWAFSEMGIYRYRIFREERYVWEVYLDKDEYELARKYCKNDPIKIDKVLSKQADDLFKKKCFEESAVIYAQTHTSFEEIALKFLEARQDGALRKFLLKKLDGLKLQDKTQITMIVMWLMEIYLNELGVLRTSGRKSSQEFVNLQQEFRKLMKEPKIKECISNNRSAVYNLMSNHGDEENLIYFTNLMKDFEKVILYHLQHKNYRAALLVLTEHSRPELFYMFSPALMQTNPKETVDAWIAQDRRLNPVQLIPALVQFDSNNDPRLGNEAIRYLEYCVDKMGVRDQAIHNYLLTLYARLQETEKLMTYLQQQDESDVPYDQKYALRICSELTGLEKACVHIYTTMGLYEEAVDLALKVDVELGKQNADRPEDNDDLRKKLWLKIAKHVVKEKNDIKRAMEVLQECDLIKIEDILPFFPDFVTIDHFKDAICSSLHDYNQHIEGLKEEMEVATQSTQEIRTEIQTFRNKFNMVTAQEKCASCGYPIMGRSFYLFPCKHVFHSVCMVSEVQPHLPPTKQNRITELQRQLAALVGQDDSASISSASLMSASVSTKDKLTAELDDLVASECLYCGDIMIRSIDVTFLNMSEYSSILKSWE